jgi:hypothetical protein
MEDLFRYLVYKFFGWMAIVEEIGCAVETFVRANRLETERRDATNSSGDIFGDGNPIYH